MDTSWQWWDIFLGLCALVFGAILFRRGLWSGFVLMIAGFTTFVAYYLDTQHVVGTVRTGFFALSIAIILAMIVAWIIRKVRW